MTRTIEEIRASHEYMAGLTTLPHYMRESIQAYIEQGRPVGNFLTALLSNDLMETLARADDINQAALRTWCEFLYNYAPPKCYRSKEAFKTWQAKGGLRGGAGE